MFFIDVKPAQIDHKGVQREHALVENVFMAEADQESRVAENFHATSAEKRRLLQVSFR